MLRRSVLAFACAGSLTMCGGSLTTTDAGQTDASDGSTLCTSNGVQLCGGPCGFDNCPEAACASFSGDAGDPSALAMCYAGNDGGPSLLTCAQVACVDGNTCALRSSDIVKSDPASSFALMGCANSDFSALFHLNGHNDMARYVDRAVFDGTAVPPAPSTCPAINGVPLCGGACGSCPTTAPYPSAGYVCAGRSPLHPISMCVNVQDVVFGQAFVCQRDSTHPGQCAGALSCFTYKVDDASQTIADANSFAIDSSACVAAAASLPGGGYCTCPP